MPTNLGDRTAFVAVARAGGFREGAKASNTSASRLSEAVRRLEVRPGLHPLAQRGLARVRLPPASTVLEGPGRGPPRLPSTTPRIPYPASCPLARPRTPFIRPWTSLVAHLPWARGSSTTGDP